MKIEITISPSENMFFLILGVFLSKIFILINHQLDFNA